jgi:uncharacterized surface protein with fasciclin (FAS1) repeats
MKKDVMGYKKIIVALLINLASSLSGADLLEEISKRPELEIFGEAIKYGGGEQILTVTSESFLLNKLMPFMIFAPTNDAMQKAGYTKEIIKATAVADGYVEGVPDKYSYKLRDFICQHIMMRAQERKEILKKSYERLHGTTIKVENEIIKTNTNQAHIITPDIEATNGMIHTIDAILEL